MAFSKRGSVIITRCGLLLASVSLPSRWARPSVAIIVVVAASVLFAWLVWTVLTGSLGTDMAATGPDEPGPARAEMEDARCLSCL
jgi:ABC-type uncharacterized transport system permease subunit